MRYLLETFFIVRSMLRQERPKGELHALSFVTGKQPPIRATLDLFMRVVGSPSAAKEYRFVALGVVKYTHRECCM
jgi:hypothetical protein